LFSASALSAIMISESPTSTSVWPIPPFAPGIRMRSLPPRTEVTKSTTSAAFSTMRYGVTLL
jgi:hypothetical protein